MRVVSGSSSGFQGQEKLRGELHTRRSCMMGFWRALWATSLRAEARMVARSASSSLSELSGVGSDASFSMSLKYCVSLTSA